MSRLRAYSLGQQQRLVALLAAHGVAARGGEPGHGAFVTVRSPRAGALARDLGTRNIAVDARGEWLRLCPDVLTTDDELERAAEVLGALARA